jgi:tRNA (guanine-N7-)-methyltransferase
MEGGSRRDPPFRLVPMFEHEQFQKKLYGRRKGPKLSAHKEDLRRTLLPALALTLVPGADPRDYFSPPVEDVWLEVGFGAGEHMLALARANPTVGLIGAEPYESGVAKLLSKLHELSSPVCGGRCSEGAEPGGGGGNIRIHEGDARDILAALPDGSLGKIFVLFPDPWPKTRHHKRRFVQTEMLTAFARVLRPGGEFRFASDDAGYAAWTLERTLNHPAFAWTAQSPADFTVRPAQWPPTRYEAKALHGPPVYYSFVRV